MNANPPTTHQKSQQANSDYREQRRKAPASSAHKRIKPVSEVMLRILR